MNGKEGKKMFNLSYFLNITELPPDNVVDIFANIFDSSYGDSSIFLTML